MLLDPGAEAVEAGHFEGGHGGGGAEAEVGFFGDGPGFAALGVPGWEEVLHYEGVLSACDVRAEEVFVDGRIVVEAIFEE